MNDSSQACKSPELVSASIEWAGFTLRLTADAPIIRGRQKPVFAQEFMRRPKSGEL